MQIMPNSLKTLYFYLDFWSISDKRDQSGASACVADLDFVIKYFFLLSSVSKLEVLSLQASTLKVWAFEILEARTHTAK